MILEGIFDHPGLSAEQREAGSLERVLNILGSTAEAIGVPLQVLDCEARRVEISISLVVEGESRGFRSSLANRVRSGEASDDDLQYLFLRARRWAQFALWDWFEMASRWKWRRGFTAGGVLSVWLGDRYVTVTLDRDWEAQEFLDGCQLTSDEGEQVNAPLDQVHVYISESGKRQQISPCGEAWVDLKEAKPSLLPWCKANPLILDGHPHHWILPDGIAFHLLEPMQAATNAAVISLTDLGVSDAQLRSWLD